MKSVAAHANDGRIESSISVLTATGERLEASGGVHIHDHFSEVGLEGIEVSVLGISHPVYATLFPEHVASYERQFKLRRD